MFCEDDIVTVSEYYCNKFPYLWTIGKEYRIINVNTQHCLALTTNLDHEGFADSNDLTLISKLPEWF